MSSDARRRLNLSAGMASIAVATVLVVMKGWAAVATGSLSLAASLADSAIDLLASTAGLFGILYAARPPDDDHSFGHGSVEDLVALGQALLVAAAAGLIAWTAVGRLGRPPPLEAEATGLVVIAVAIVVTLGLVVWQTRVAAATGSKIVAADRLHYLSDLLPNLGAVVAIVASTRFGLHGLDPVIALLACAALLYGARNIGVDAWHALMDRSADPDLLARIGRVLAAHPGIDGHHDLKTRTAGTRVFIQVHVEIDGALSLEAAHAIAAGLKRDLLAALPDADVIIHMDPV